MNCLNACVFLKCFLRYCTFVYKDGTQALCLLPTMLSPHPLIQVLSPSGTGLKLDIFQLHCAYSSYDVLFKFRFWLFVGLGWSVSSRSFLGDMDVTDPVIILEVKNFRKLSIPGASQTEALKSTWDLAIASFLSPVWQCQTHTGPG